MSGPTAAGVYKAQVDADDGRDGLLREGEGTPALSGEFRSSAE